MQHVLAQSHGWTVFHCMDRSRFIYSFISGWTMSSHFWVTMNTYIRVQVWCEHTFSFLSDMYLHVEWLGPQSFKERSDCFPKQLYPFAFLPGVHERVLISPHARAHQHLLSAVSLPLAIVVGVKWELTATLICICLIMNSFSCACWPCVCLLWTTSI